MLIVLIVVKRKMIEYKTIQKSLSSLVSRVQFRRGSNGSWVKLSMSSSRRNRR